MQETYPLLSSRLGLGGRFWTTANTPNTPNTPNAGADSVGERLRTSAGAARDGPLARCLNRLLVSTASMCAPRQPTGTPMSRCPSRTRLTRRPSIVATSASQHRPPAPGRRSVARAPSAAGTTLAMWCTAPAPILGSAGVRPPRAHAHMPRSRPPADCRPPAATATWWHGGASRRQAGSQAGMAARTGSFALPRLRTPRPRVSRREARQCASRYLYRLRGAGSSARMGAARTAGWRRGLGSTSAWLPTTCDPPPRAG
jgi:hypothetical protein